MKVIIFQNDNGGVSTCFPTGEISIEAVLEKDIPKNSGGRIVEQDSLPNEHVDFYDAWEMDATTVTVNFDKAKELTKARLRVERELLLATQDIAYQRALETSADTTAIVAEKQRLRDITKLADAADTLEALRALSC